MTLLNSDELSESTSAQLGQLLLTDTTTYPGWKRFVVIPLQRLTATISLVGFSVRQSCARRVQAGH